MRCHTILRSDAPLPGRDQIGGSDVTQQKEIKAIVVNNQKIYHPGINDNQLDNTILQTEATIPALRIQLRQSQTICLLLGIPPTDLETQLEKWPIPTAPAEVAIGIPALLERVPSVRSAKALPRPRPSRSA